MDSGDRCGYKITAQRTCADGTALHLNCSGGYTKLCVCVCAYSVMSDSLWLLDCSLPDSYVHGISQARTLEWVAISCSRGSSWPRIEPMSLTSPAMAGRVFTTESPTQSYTCDKITHTHTHTCMLVKLLDCTNVHFLVLILYYGYQGFSNVEWEVKGT